MMKDKLAKAAGIRVAAGTVEFFFWGERDPEHSIPILVTRKIESRLSRSVLSRFIHPSSIHCCTGCSVANGYDASPVTDSDAEETRSITQVVAARELVDTRYIILIILFSRFTYCVPLLQSQQVRIHPTGSLLLSLQLPSLVGHCANVFDFR